MKNCLKKIKHLLFLCTFLFITSCSKDNYEELIAKDNNTMKVEVLNSKAIKKEKALFSTISKLNQKLSRLNSLEKNVTSGVYNFSIDTDYCKMITLDSVTSYTFSITREPSNEDFENIVIKRLPNGVLISKLYKYNVTPEEKHNILHGIDVDMTNKIEVADIDDTEFTSSIFQKALLCYQAEMVMSSGTPCKGEEHHAYGDTTCPFINSPYMQAQAPTLSVVYVPIDCGGGAGGTYYGPNGQPYPGYPPGVLDTGVITSPVQQISFEEEQYKIFKKSLTQAQQDWLTQQNQQNENVDASIFDFLNINDFDTESENFIGNLINYLIQNTNFSFDYVFYNKTDFDINNSNETDNYSSGGFDTNTYSAFNPQQNWSNISSVIPVTQFVGWGTPGVKRNCMDYAKAQIAKKGYQISAYNAIGQTFQVYTSQNGVNTTQLSQGLNYLKYALSNGIPVVVGVDDAPGHPGNLDNTTDHFIVIVGMGSNSNGNYFQFYDNASGVSSQGASSLNLLYYNSTTGIISGSSQTSYGQGQPYPYILTMIRKSKLL